MRHDTKAQPTIALSFCWQVESRRVAQAGQERERGARRACELLPTSLLKKAWSSRCSANRVFSSAAPAPPESADST
jgi:hypothetical protein